MSKEQFDGLDRLQRADHDTLIEVKAVLVNLVNELKELREGSKLQVADHETRLKVIERMHETADPIKVSESVQKLVQWKYDTERDLKLTQKILTVAWGAVGGLVLFILQQTGKYFHWIK